MADRNALARATEQSSSPTPGYLYNDIAKQAATSPSISSEILSYLLRRLAKNNAHVKYKTLKTISMVCQNANSRGMFKRAVMQDTQAITDIKGCLNYRGRPDAVHGDQLYEKVRAQAKETLDAVYSDEPTIHSMNMSSQGSASFGGGGGYGQSGGGGYGGMQNQGGFNPSGPKKMEGIGNPMFKDPRLEVSNQKSIGEMTIGDVAAAAVEGFKGIVKDPLARNISSSGQVSHRPGGMGGYGGPSGGWNSAPPGQAQLANSTNGQWTMASNRGPNAISSESYRAGSGNVSSGIGGSWGAPSSVAASSRMAAHAPPVNRNPVVNISGPPGAANTSGTFEKNMIMELCPPGGMKPEPPADKLANFCQSLPDLNSDLVCPALLDMLEDGQPWIIRAKVLCVMEKCIHVGNEMSQTTGNNVYADFFFMCREEISPLANHSRSAVREPAKRVCKALGLDTPAFAANAPKKAAVAPKAVQQPVEAPNLLDFDEPAIAPPPVPSAAPPMPPSPPAQAPPVPPAQSAGSGGSLFGGMTMKASPAPAVSSAPSAPAPATAPAPAPPAPTVSGDLFGSVEVVQPAPATAPVSAVTQPAVSGLFDDMVVNPTKESAAVTVSAENPPASGGSSFSFMNTGGETAKKPEAPKQSFDPLLSMGASSSSAPSQTTQQQAMGGMTMSPQMAMVMQQQQQQIMMMQAQMQQMQMASGGQQRFMMPQRQTSSGSVGGRANVMGAMGGHGVNTSFAFMEDPTKTKREASNKKFDFVQDAMNSAK